MKSVTSIAISASTLPQFSKNLNIILKNFDLDQIFISGAEGYSRTISGRGQKLRVINMNVI